MYRWSTSIAMVLLLILAGTYRLRAQQCTTDPFSKQILPFCDPGGDGGGTTAAPENLTDFVQATNGTWTAVNVSQLTGAQVLGAPPSAIMVGSEYHVFVPDFTTGHLREFIRSSGGTWSVLDLNAVIGQNFPTNVPTAVLTPDGTEHVFANGNGDLLDFHKPSGGSWSITDITVSAGFPPSSSFSPVGAVAVAVLGSDIHVYAFLSSHLQEYYLPSGTTRWIFTDVSQRVNSVSIEGAISVLNLGNAVEVYAPSSSNGHVMNFQGTNFTSSGGTWQVFDQTNNSGGLVTYVGIPYVAASPIVYGTSLQIFLDGGNKTADMECMIEVSGQWQTIDLSTVAVNGESLGLLSQQFALVDGANVHVYGPGLSGHMLEWFKQPNPANWVVTDITNITGKVLEGIATTAFKDPNTGQFHVFGNTN